jgi:hypothetical protein
MSKIPDDAEDDLRPEYDMAALLKTSRPNPYATAYREGTNVVLLEPDVREVFKDSESVNAALRLVIQLRAVGAQPQRRKKRAG